MGVIMDQVVDQLPNEISRIHLTNLKERLRQVSTAWSLSDYESLLQFYIHILPRIMDAERCTIYIKEIGTAKIYSKFGTGLQGKQIEPPLEGSIVGEVTLSGNSIIQNDMSQKNGYHRKVDEGTGYITLNTVCVPIKSVTGRGVTGAIQVLNKKGEADFADEDLRMLEEIAQYLSMSIENIVVNQEMMRISSQLNREVERLDKEFFHDTQFIAESSGMREVLELVRVVCETPVSVLLQGENGTGKELIARLIHNFSDRRDQPFVAVNCASIPENLMESEFFGYEKGAFTGADHIRKGRFEEADGGTLFLDEIADMPQMIQPKFLRAIQEGEGSRLGSNKLIQYNFRLISATNKNLQEEVTAGRFREDLYFRLFTVEIRLPPLRERKEDIVPLAHAFLKDVAHRFKKNITSFAPDVLKILENYSWPGNVRQLLREIERLVAFTPDMETIKSERCSPELLAEPKTKNSIGMTGENLPEQVKALEIKLIVKALKKTNGNRASAANLLNITRQGLYKKMKRYQMEEG